MYRIKTLNKISATGLNRLDKTRFEVGDEVVNESGILVRSAKMHDYEFPASLQLLWDTNTLDFVHYETTYYIAGHLLSRLRELMGGSV